MRAIVDSDIASLARAVLCTVRRRIERLTGRLPSEGEAFGVMLDHALQSCDLQIALGVRPGAPSLAVYGSGDRLISAARD